jgi:hypothetical protein
VPIAPEVRRKRRIWARASFSGAAPRDGHREQSAGALPAAATRAGPLAVLNWQYVVQAPLAVSVTSRRQHRLSDELPIRPKKTRPFTKDRHFVAIGVIRRPRAWTVPASPLTARNAREPSPRS